MAAVLWMEDPAAHLSDAEIKVDFSANCIIFNLNTDNFYVSGAYSTHGMGIILQIYTPLNKKCLILFDLHKIHKILS